MIREENLLERCRARSQRLLSGLRKLVERYKCDPLEEVRGEGLLIGLEFSPLLPSIATHYRASDATGMLKYIMRDLDGLIDTVPTMYAMQSLLNVYGIYSQVGAVESVRAADPAAAHDRGRANRPTARGTRDHRAGSGRLCDDGRIDRLQVDDRAFTKATRARPTAPRCRRAEAVPANRSPI